MEINILKSEIDQIKSKLDEVQKENERIKIYNGELEETNNHLISATWREREMKEKLANTISELNNTKEILESQNIRIAESINYSRKIQNAINPDEEDLKTHIKDSFILYKPKDTISGDFPWMYRKGKYLYLAAVDCTGHGVPGAMMSMIGSLLLNDIVNGEDDFLPSEILLKLHLAVVKTLKQDEPESNSSDGMDIGLCRINLEDDTLLYSGAHRPLIFLRNNEIIQLKGDKFPIGGMQYKSKNNYTDHEVIIQKDDAFYVYSDGLTDQIGGPENKKYMTNSLKEIILENPTLSMANMKILINQSFENWKGSNKQIDDVVLIGFKK
jgi:serine phosphatase RsbU (regulator of sigma subunit)